MKNLLKITLLFIAAGILFASCKTMSLTKRHYNKGYYVSHSGKKSKATAYNLPQQKAELLSPKNISLPVAKNNDLGLVASNSKPDEIINKETKNVKDVENKIRYAGASGSDIAKEIVKSPFKITKMVPAADRGDDALSLIWIVIVVLLILYLFGLLFDGFGLGGLIHVLAVIALVLLILWLLRII